jgi:hypothetical protein
VTVRLLASVYSGRSPEMWGAAMGVAEAEGLESGTAIGLG